MQSRMAIITFVDPGDPNIPSQGLPGQPVYPSGGPVFPTRPVDPGYGRPDWSGRPDNSLPWGPGRPDAGLPWGPGRPDNSLPPYGHIWLPVFGFDPTRPDAGLPVAPVRPDAGLPGSQPGVDNTLPGGGGGRPSNELPALRPGAKFVVKYLACQGLILVPDNELPETAEPK